MDGEDLGLLDNSGTGDEGGGGDQGGGELDEALTPPGGEGGGEDAGEGGDQGGDDDEQRRAEGREIVKFTPDTVRKGIREIATTNPDFLKKFPNFEKAVTRALYKDSQIQELGGLQEINRIVEAVEVHGGIEGIEELAAEVEAGRELEQGFEKGDPAVIDGWAKDYPLGFKKLMVPALEKLKTLDKPQFEAVASFLISSVFDEYGVYSTIAALGEAIAKLKPEDGADSVKHFNALAKFLGDSKALAKNARIGSGDRDAELDEGRAKLAKKEREIVYSAARMEVNPRIMAEMNRLIRLQLPRGATVKVEVANRLRKEINAETRARMNSEPDFARNFEALLNAGDKSRLARLIYTRACKYLPKVVPQLVKEFGLKNAQNRGSNTNTNGQRRQANGGGGGSGTVTGRPKTSEVDFRRTDKAVWLMTMNTHGQAWGLDGKLHKW